MCLLRHKVRTQSINSKQAQKASDFFILLTLMQMFLHWNVSGAIVANILTIDTLFTRIIFTIATL